MENIFFCARNIEDYLSPLIKAVDKKIVDFEDKNLMFTKDIQDFFQSVMKKHLKRENYFELPMSNEVDTGIDGLKLDFNYGLRLEVPAGDWRVKISDADSDLISVDGRISNKRLCSIETYYIHWRVEIFHDGVSLSEGRGGNVQKRAQKYRYDF